MRYYNYTHNGNELLAIDRSQLPEQALQVVYEAVHISFPSGFVDDILVVVVAEATRQLLVVHLGLVLADAPTPRHLYKQPNFS